MTDPRPEQAPDGLSPAAVTLAVAMANEGIPVQAIARVIRQPSGDVFSALQSARLRGDIFEVPKADWPPTGRRADRIPSHYHNLREEDFIFTLSRRYSLSKLECRFLVTLLRNERASKEKLHAVVERLRNARATRPDDMEQTDQKMVDVIICKLRKRLRAVDPDVKILTEWGVGYYMTNDARQFVYATVNKELGDDGSANASAGPVSERTASA
jgi:hypothetical protein